MISADLMDEAVQVDEVVDYHLLYLIPIYLHPVLAHLLEVLH